MKQGTVVTVGDLLANSSTLVEMKCSMQDDTVPVSSACCIFENERWQAIARTFSWKGLAITDRARYSSADGRVSWNTLEQVESALQSQPLLDLLMPPLMAQWAGLAETDRGLLGLMEAIKSLAAALGDRCLPAYVEAFFNRSAQIIWNTSGNIAAAKRDPSGASELEIPKVRTC
jgi:hypothetical protein